MFSQIVFMYVCIPLVFSAKIITQAKGKRKECMRTIGMRGRHQENRPNKISTKLETSELASLSSDVLIPTALIHSLFFLFLARHQKFRTRPPHLNTMGCCGFCIK
jgi:hypothetical protein